MSCWQQVLMLYAFLIGYIGDLSQFHIIFDKIGRELARMFIRDMKIFGKDNFIYHGGTSISPSTPDNHGTYVFESNTSQMRSFSDDIRIHPVQNHEDFKKFYQVPFQVYRDDPYWVAPFWGEQRDFFKKNNPFWSHAHCALFIARKQTKVVGRIAAIIDEKYCELTGENIGFFGFFECLDEDDVAQALLQTAHDWLKERKMNRMRGPIDGRVDVGCGFLLAGFHSRPSLLSSYSPEYYLAFVDHFGMKKIRDLILYYIDLTKPIPSKLEEKAKQCAASGIMLRPFHRFRTGKELRWWIDFFLETFADHWGYVPVPPEEVRTRFGVKQLRWIADPRLFLIAEDQGSPVAYLWATPEYNEVFQKMNGRLGLGNILKFFYTRGRIRIGKLHLIGIKKEYRDRNIGSYLNYAVLVEMKQRGFTGAEVGWIDEENIAAHTTIAITGATVYKKYRVFEALIRPTQENER
jgi:ribosomal protein S18 acetylase RimI-like enzyme